MASKFNLGDRIRVTDPEHPNHDTEATVVGTPTPAEGSPCHCDCETLDGRHHFSADEGQVAVVDHAKPEGKRGPIGHDPDRPQLSPTRQAPKLPEPRQPHLPPV